MQLSNALSGAINTDRSSRFLLLILVVVLTATFALRLINLDADPVPWFTGEIGYQIDEGYKTLSPRNLYVYGDTHWNQNDEYRGWMNSSAMTQWPYYLAFKTFGEKLSSARIVSIIYAVSFLIITAFFLWQRLPPKLAVLGIVLLATDPALFLFSRSALFETSIIFYVYIAIFLSATLKPKVQPLAFVPLIIISIVSIKYLKESVLLYMLPVAVSIFFIPLRAKFNHALINKIIIISLIFLSLLGLLLFIQSNGSSATNINFDKYLHFPQALFLNPVHMLSPLALTISYVITIELLIRKPDFLLDNWYRLSLVMMLILVPVMMSFFTYNVPRYHLPILPAAFLLIVERLNLDLSGQTERLAGWLSLEKILAAIAFLALTMTIIATGNYYVISHIPINLGDDPGLSDIALLKIFPFALIFFVIVTFLVIKRHWATIDIKVYEGFSVLHIVIGVGIITAALAAPSYQSQAIKQALSQHMQVDESIGGDWAPFFVADTILRGLYMRPDFNSAERVETLRPDYFLHSSTPYDTKNFAHLQKIKAIKIGDEIKLGTYAEHELSLYSIEYLQSAGKTNPTSNH